PKTDGFPDATNTGFRGAGLSESDLRDSGVSGTWRINSPGVYSDFKHAGLIEVNANNVTLRRCLVRTTSVRPLIINRAKNLVVEDCTFVGLGQNKDNICAAAIGYGEYTARRVNVSQCADGLKLASNTTIEDSYIHNLAGDRFGNGAGTHNDAFQLNNGSGASSNILVRGDTVTVEGCTSNRLFQIGAPVTNLRIENNFLGGLHGIINARDVTGRITGNTYQGSTRRGPFSTHQGKPSPGLYTGSLGGMTRSGNVFESGESADTDTRVPSYQCVN
ncbi:MAG: hypothetical protein AAFY60_12230, partial [Myxococcota bacterium]